MVFKLAAELEKRNKKSCYVMCIQTETRCAVNYALSVWGLGVGSAPMIVCWRRARLLALFTIVADGDQ